MREALLRQVLELYFSFPPTFFFNCVMRKTLQRQCYFLVAMMMLLYSEKQSELELLRSENGELRSAAAGERTRPSSPHSAKTVGASRSAPLESATRPSAKQLLRTTSPSQLRRPRPQTASGALDSQRGQWDVGQSDAQLQVPLDLRTVRRGQLGKGGQSGRAVWEDTPGSAQRPELGAAPIGEHSADVPLFGLNYGDTPPIRRSRARLGTGRHRLASGGGSRGSAYCRLR
ncbi:hypothetical protein T492DRAFT_839903 [Pavlovales sp. CCMP2436]|nr:hypothetical protein T492DRAFT_839903 [Pavlovales sp. CCMP2436]